MKIIRSIALTSFVLGLAPHAHAQEPPAKPASAAPRNITIDDFFQIRDVAQPELSLENGGARSVYISRYRCLSAKPVEVSRGGTSNRFRTKAPCRSESSGCAKSLDFLGETTGIQPRVSRDVAYGLWCTGSSFWVLQSIRLETPCFPRARPVSKSFANPLAARSDSLRLHI